jgi:hypothetical protein
MSNAPTAASPRTFVNFIGNSPIVLGCHVCAEKTESISFPARRGS